MRPALLHRPARPGGCLKPEENLEIVVAGGPGGGTDQLARLVQSAISQNKLLDVNTVVLNRAAATAPKPSST